MFNPFKKKTVDKVVNTVKQAFADEHEIIADIHNAFDSASERLLNEAKSIIDNAKEDLIAKGNRLKSLGFNSSKVAIQSDKEVQKQKDSKDLAEHIMYYKQWYPFHKFIIEKEIKNICEKYSLVFGDATNYKGDIPERNIQEIEKFSLREEDMCKEILAYHEMQRTPNYIYYKRTSEKTNLYGFTRRNFGYEHFISMPEDQKCLYSKEPFKICAPEKDFDMRDKKVEGYKIVPKDPIVLQPVKGGYLIVTKWGLEASDELVVNEINN